MGIPAASSFCEGDVMIERVNHRRQFLRQAMAGAAGLVPMIAPRQSRAATNLADVLIIGAGMSGAAAGWALQSAGIRPMLLEGRPDRIGGRIWTSYAWADAPVDLGASWLTHRTINPLATIASQQGIRTVPSDLLNLTLSEPDGRILPQEEVDEVFSIYSATYAGVKTISAERMAARLPDIPASRAFETIFAYEKLSPQMLQKVGFFLNYTIKEPNAAPLRDLSLNYWDDDYVFVQLYTDVFPNGYVQLVNYLARGLDIRLNHKVSEIAYGPEGVTVATNQGSFQAPYAIVTLPHAILHRDAVTFAPDLPAWKRGAIRRLHTGLSDKFYLRFPRLFWDPEPNTLGRIAETSESHWSTWLNFYKYTGIPMLMVFNRDEYAHRLEGMSDTQVIDAAMAVLRKQYGSRIPDPVGMQRSAWAMDPFARGTLPHVPPGASGADYELMGQPVGSLRFAGDATNADFPGLAMGAFLSGVREAGQVAALLGLGGLASQDAMSVGNVGGGPSSARPARRNPASPSSNRARAPEPIANRASSSDHAKERQMSPPNRVGAGGGPSDRHTSPRSSPHRSETSHAPAAKGRPEQARHPASKPEASRKPHQSANSPAQKRGR
jgi:monoamine oxidase